MSSRPTVATVVVCGLLLLLLSSFRGLSRRCSLLFITCTGGGRERGGEWMGLWWLKLDKGLGNTPKTLLAVCVWGVHAAARRLAALTLTLTRSHALNTHAHTHTHTGMQARTHTHTQCGRWHPAGQRWPFKLSLWELIDV